jgi:hypothetical protein
MNLGIEGRTAIVCASRGWDWRARRRWRRKASMS